MVEFRALLNIGDGYIPKDANCEHDMTFAQFGVPYSPTANGAKILTGLGAALLFVKIFFDE
jgi:hypothetical protein